MMNLPALKTFSRIRQPKEVREPVISEGVDCSIPTVVFNCNAVLARTLWGLSYDIYHPDLVWVGWSDLQIGFAHPDHPDIYDKTIRIAMSHVVGIEDIPAKKASKKS